MRDARYDQATGLRRLFARDSLQVLSVAGASTADATSITLNLAAALSRLGHRLLVVDLAHGEAALSLGTRARYDLAHVLRGDKALCDVLVRTQHGVTVLAAARGLESIARDGACWRRTLENLFDDAGESFDVWLVNGVAPPVADNGSPLLVIAPTRDAITGAYARIKALAKDHGQREFRIVVDHATSERAALNAYKSIASTSRQFLSARLDYCGYLPHDDAPVSTVRRPSASLADSDSARGHAFARLAEAVAAGHSADPSRFAFQPGK
jgi:flagellar biosynthesis protein FlhG